MKGIALFQFLGLRSQTAQFKVALRAPAVPLPGIKILHSENPFVKAYRYKPVTKGYPLCLTYGAGGRLLRP